MGLNPRQTSLLGEDEVTGVRADEVTHRRDKPGGSPKDGGSLEEGGLLDLRGKSVWVIDGMSLIFQVFHAIPEMTGPRGQPVNAVFGFTRDIFYLIEQKQPDYLFCAYDTADPTFRHELSDTY